MARFSKKLPENRADFSFSDLVYWHVLVYGSRKEGDPSAKVGEPWDLDSLAPLLDVDERTLRNWMSGKSRPARLGLLISELFGKNPLFDEWRLELLEAYRNTLLNESEVVPDRPETPEVSGGRPNSNGSAVKPSGTSNSESAGGGVKPPHPDDATANASPSAQETDASAPLADHVEASNLSDATEETAGHTAADAGSDRTDKGKRSTDSARNNSTQSRNEEAPDPIINPVVPIKNSSTGSSDRYFRYRKRIAIVGVGLVVMMGLNALRTVTGPKPEKPPEGSTPSVTASEPAPAATSLTASPSPAATPLPKQLTTAPTVPAAPSAGGPATTLNSPSPTPIQPELKPAPLAAAPTITPPLVQKPAETVPAAPTTNAPAATLTAETAPPTPPEAKATPQPAAPTVTPPLEQKPVETVSSAPTKEPASPITKGVEASMPQTSTAPVPPAANPQSNKQGSGKPLSLSDLNQLLAGLKVSPKSTPPATPTIVPPQKNAGLEIKSSPSAAPAGGPPPPPPKGVEASIPQASTATEPPAANSQPNRQGKPVPVSELEKILAGLEGLSPKATCDRNAAAAWDPDAQAEHLAGVEFKEVQESVFAVESCDKAVKKDPQNRRLWFQLGRSFDGVRKFDNAKGAYDTAAKLGSSSALVNIGMLFAQGKIAAVADRPKARDYYRRAAVQANPEGMYQYATSLAFDDKAGALDQNEARVWFKRALDKRMVNPGRAEEALRRLQ